MGTWLLLDPIVHSEHLHLTKLCTIVEINTLLLTANRLRRHRIMEIAFYGTWVCMRLLWYPYLIHYFHKTLIAWGAMPTLADYSYCQVVGSMVGLNGLNFFWTAELLVNMLYNKRQDTQKASLQVGESLRPNPNAAQELMRVKTQNGDDGTIPINNGTV